MPGSVVLLAWELGAGFGHARRLLSLAHELKQRGFQPVVAARELQKFTTEYHDARIPLVQAPMFQWQAPKNEVFKARSYADLLAACAYQRDLIFVASHRRMGEFLRLLKPSLIIADYSPILALAAYGRVPFLAIGSGFVLPPRELPRFPELRREGTLMAPEGELFANALEVQRRRNLPRPTSLPALVAGDAQVVCTFPEIDVYAKHRTFAASGPLGKTPPPLDPAHGKGVFAYLAADYPFTVKLLQALADTRVPITAFVRDVPEALAGSLSRSGIRLYRTPPQLPTALREVSLVVHHGGIGTSEICLALGRPQLLLFRHLEQHCNATMLENLGVAKSLHAIAFHLRTTRTTRADAAGPSV